MKARRTLLAIASALAAASMAGAATIHVPGDQPTIQQGIDAAVNGDEVVVADGTWYGDNNKNLDFFGKAITVRSASGDSLTCIIDCQQDGRAFHFHSGEPAEARVEGFTVRNGWIDDPSIWGGAILCENASGPTIVNCRFSDNVAVGDGNWAGGGAMYNEGGDVRLLGCAFEWNTVYGWYSRGGAVYSRDGQVTGTDCVFDYNVSGGWCGGKGGAIYSENDSLDLHGCSFTWNYAGGGPCGGVSIGQGGGVYHDGGAATVTNCTFFHNKMRGNPSGGGNFMCGAGFCNWAGTATLVNCLFLENLADPMISGEGGAIFADGSLTAINCTIVNNSVDQGGGIWVAGQGTVATNCIVRGNTPDSFGGYYPATVTFSNVEGGHPGQGNLDADPMFVNPFSDLHLLPGSPCIDAADNNAVSPDVLTDLDGNPRFVDDPDTPDTGIGTPPIVDMGAFEFQVASPCPADVNGDGTVDVLDLLAVLAAWGATSGPEDINGDGIVNVLDLLEVLASWGPCE